jgi:alpha-beta hydrolase superfamily lysophospholipase
MGGLTITTLLTNNPNLKISGVILSAPFFGFHPRKPVDESKKAIVKILQPHLEVTLVLKILRNLLSILVCPLIWYAGIKEYSECS